MNSCEICGSSFKGRKGKANKFCSLDCYRVFQRSGDYTIEKNRTLKPEPCFSCGKDVIKSKSKNRDGTHSDKVYCSRGCYDSYRAKVRASRSINCRYCKSSFIPANATSVYCSIECRNLDVTVNCEAKCITCGVSFSAISYRPTTNGRFTYVKSKGRRVCSDECRREFYRNDKSRKLKISAAFKGDKHPLWRGGVSSMPQSRGTLWRTVRKECLIAHNWKCVKCGITNDESLAKYKTGLHIDHIKPWHGFDDELKANAQSNLRPLCISCHGKHGDKVKHGMYSDKNKGRNRIPAIVSKSGITLEQMFFIRDNYKTNGVSWSNISELHEKTGITKYLIRTIGNGTHPICKYFNDDKRIRDYIESQTKK